MRSRAAVVFIIVISIVFALFLSNSTVTNSASPPPVPANFEDVAIASVAAPTGIAFTQDERLFITPQPGERRISQNGALRAPPALNIASRLCRNSERGLLGIAA